MFFDAHRGAEVPSPFQTRSDGRVQTITDLLFEQEVRGRGATRLLGDSERSLQPHTQNLQMPTPLLIGRVVHALPGLNWYKVQLAYGGGWIGCRMASEAACLPVGVRRGNPVPSGSRVLVWRDLNDDTGTILLVLPHALEDPRVSLPDWLAQGSGCGYKREAAHKALFRMSRLGGVQDFSCQSPLDATSMEWSRVSETGVTLLVSVAEAVLRVNELCGLWMSLYDSHVLLTGFQLDVSTAARECRYRHDEGEHRVDEHEPIYPWEGVGAYNPDTEVVADFDPAAVQYALDKGAVDLPDRSEDTQPFYRVQRYGGYLGQGGLRLVVAQPTDASHVRRMQDAQGSGSSAGAQDVGVFAEHVGLDGSYVLQSAKSILIAKRCKITVPRECRLPEDASGDDAEADNYRFSGYFGTGGAAHVVHDLAVNALDTTRPMLSVAGVEDVLAWNVNWKRLHPFHYHSKDYKTWQQSGDLDPFARTSELLDFDTVKSTGYLADPVPVTVDIDHRYNQVSYFLREAFLAFNDDGSVVLAGGAGEELTFANGRVRLAAPGGVEVLPGCEFLVTANEIILKSQGSVDVSSSRQGVRLRAYHNLHLLGEDDVLIEAKSPSANQFYENQIGEDVVGGGIVLKSQSVVALLGDEIYARSGVGNSGAGDVVLDAAKRHNNVVMNGLACRAFIEEGFEIWAMGAGGKAVASHYFGPDCAHHHTPLIVTGDATLGACKDSTVAVRGHVDVSGNIAAAGQIGSGGGGLLHTIPGNFAGVIRGVADAQCTKVVNFTDAGLPAFDAALTNEFYKGNQVGDDATIGFIGFSYRDPDTPGLQYHTQNLVFAEPRWQQIVRLGGGSGGDAWVEHPVSYQGRELYPWPGREKTITDAVFLQLDLTMHDWANGYDEDRPGPYEQPALADPTFVTLASGFKVMHQT